MIINSDTIKMQSGLSSKCVYNFSTSMTNTNYNSSIPANKIFGSYKCIIANFYLYNFGSSIGIVTASFITRPFNSGYQRLYQVSLNGYSTATIEFDIYYMFILDSDNGNIITTFIDAKAYQGTTIYNIEESMTSVSSYNTNYLDYSVNLPLSGSNRSLSIKTYGIN